MATMGVGHDRHCVLVLPSLDLIWPDDVLITAAAMLVADFHRRGPYGLWVEVTRRLCVPRVQMEPRRAAAARRHRQDRSTVLGLQDLASPSQRMSRGG